MQRRDFVRTIFAAVAVPKLLLAQTTNPVPPPPAPVPWILGLNGATPIPATQVVDSVGEASIRFFTPVQMATLERLSDVLVPAIGDRPGALTAETPAFLDFLVGSSSEDRRKMYQGGLDWLDLQAKNQFSKPFAQLETTQADRILKPWMRTWMSDHPPTELHADFVNVAHAEIRQATMNSKAWSDVPPLPAEKPERLDLYWLPIEPDLFAERSRSFRTIPHAGSVPQIARGPL